MNERMRERIARFKKMPHLHMEAAAIIAVLLVLAFGLFKSPSTQAPNPANTEAPGAGDSSSSASSGSSSTASAPQITAPSAFPHITIKNFGQMDAHFYRGA